MNKKVIVTGATGNLGAYVSMQLKHDGFDVIALGHRKSDNGFFAEHGMTYISLDICDKEAFDKLPKHDVYAVCHFAGELPSRYHYDPVALVDSITKGTLNVLEYMRKAGCMRIVFPQTPYDLCEHFSEGVPLKPDMPRSFPHEGDHAIYTIAKNAACDMIELYHSEYGIKRYIFRFFTIYQYHPNAYHYADFKPRMMPFRMLMDRAMHSQPIEIWGDCKKAKEMVYIKDFTRLVSLALKSDKDGGFYNVGNGWQVTLEEQIKGIVKVFSPKDNPSKITYAPEKPDPLENAFDITKLKEDFGYEPKYSYIDQLVDFKHEMETEPFAKLWGTKDDYSLKTQH